MFLERETPWYWVLFGQLFSLGTSKNIIPLFSEFYYCHWELSSQVIFFFSSVGKSIFPLWFLLRSFKDAQIFSCSLSLLFLNFQSDISGYELKIFLALERLHLRTRIFQEFWKPLFIISWIFPLSINLMISFWNS